MASPPAEAHPLSTACFGALAEAREALAAELEDGLAREPDGETLLRIAVRAGQPVLAHLEAIPSSSMHHAAGVILNATLLAALAFGIEVLKALGLVRPLSNGSAPRL